MFRQNKSYIHSTIDLKKKAYIANNWKLQPLIIVVGEEKTILKEFFIYVNDKLFEFENFLKALSVLFQMHQVLMIQYAPQCIQVWHFIEKFFYEIEISGKISSALVELFTDLGL